MTSPSLGGQISITASRLDQRKKNAMALGCSLRSRIRTAITSPGGLAIAGCTGFLAAEWMHRPIKAPQAQRPASKQQASKSSRRAQTTAMSKLVLLTKLALALKLRWEKASGVL